MTQRSFARTAILAVTLLNLSCSGSSPSTPSATPAGAAAASNGNVSTKNAAPVLVVNTTPAAANGVISGGAPLKVFFGLCQSTDADAGDSLNWQFNFGDGSRTPFNGDGTFNPDVEHTCRAEHTYERPGTYTAWVSVTDKHLEDQSGNVTRMARQSRQFTVQVSDKPEAPCVGGASLATDFETVANGTAAPFSVGGVAVSGAGQVINTAGVFNNLTGQTLLATGPVTITFPSPQSSFSFGFGTNGNPVLVQAFDANGTSVFAQAFSGTPGLFFLEGAASGSANFRKLVINSTPPFFIDFLSTAGACQ